MAKKKPNTFTLGLVAAAVVLGGVMFMESKKDAPTESKDIQVWSLTENQAKDLKELHVASGDKNAKYVRDGEKWRLADKPKRDLKAGDWDTAYNNLKSLMASRKVEDKAADLKKFGLDKPAATLRWGDDQTPYAFEIGEKTPTGDAYFVHVKKDDAIYTVSSWRVDEWKNLAANPPLEPEPTPTPAPSASASPAASTAPSVAPSAAHDGHVH